MDLVILPPTSFNRAPCNVPDSGCPVEIEVISADSNQIAFTEAEDIRASAAWRNLTVGARGDPGPAHAKLVDRHCNQTTTNSLAPSEAIYIRRDVTIHAF